MPKKVATRESIHTSFTLSGWRLDNKRSVVAQQPQYTTSHTYTNLNMTEIHYKGIRPKRDQLHSHASLEHCKKKTKLSFCKAKPVNIDIGPEVSRKYFKRPSA